MTPTTELPDSVVRSMHANAKTLSRQFPMVDREDITQEMWLWVMSHTKQVNRFLADEDGEPKLCWAMRNAGLAFCQREKARRLGYEVDDIHFYSIKSLRAILPSVFDPDAWARLGSGDSDPANGVSPDPSRPDRRMDAIAALADVKDALAKLPGDLRQLLQWSFRDSYSDEQVAGLLHTSEEGARMRVRRALKRLQEQLGGERPDWNAAR